MSSRALRRLQGSSDQDLIFQHEASDSDQSEEVKPVSKKGKQKGKNPVNPFELLNADENEDPEAHEEETLEPDEDSRDAMCKDGQGETKRKKKKKKKRKNAKEAESSPKTVNEDEDEIEASLREVNRILSNERNDSQTFTVADNVQSFNTRGLLNVEHKNLNPDNELRRIFGSRVIQSTQSNIRRQRNRGRHKSSWLAHPKDSWPAVGKTGLSMINVRSNGEQHFNIEHSQQYQQIQFQFLDAVESLNPQNIANVVSLHPCNIDALIQLSEVFRMSEDMQVATDLVERALYIFETSFHPLFSLTTGTCRLDFRRPENRAFYLALFKHLTYVGQKGCYRTSLEFCKLLLSLEPEGDPMCVLLMIDFYALRSEQYDFLIRFYDEWGNHRNLKQLPNFAFSVPLAMFQKHLTNEESESERADTMLQNALQCFPGVLLALLDKCSVIPDKDAASHPFFSTNSQSTQPDGLRQLIGLYVGRCHSCWKQPEVISWLERNVGEILKKINQDPKTADELCTQYKSHYKGTPRNILRHILLSEIKDATAALPPELAHTPILSYDPLPPTDNITSYTRPSRPRRVEQETNSLALFFRSMLPNFNIDELAEDEGAAGGGNNLRQGVGALMDAMRDLLHNIRPTEPPIENPDDNNPENDDEWD